MFRRNHRLVAVCIALALTLACAPVLTPSVPPTLDPASIDTVIAETAAAAATQTALVLPPTPTPTLTPSPTNTPTITPTSTATFIFRLFTPTVPTPTSPPTSPPTGDFACEIVSQSPPNEAIFSPGADFDTHWQVINTGREVWDSNNTDYRFASGDKIHKRPLYDLAKTVSPGGRADIIVDMVAPSAAGTYSTTWRLRIGKKEFCPMKLTIVVK